MDSSFAKEPFRLSCVWLDTFLKPTKKTVLAELVVSSSDPTKTIP
jgi:hypothetical protein